ncbi:MAG TPA: amidotransferase [Nevskiaceae bacterium]
MKAVIVQHSESEGIGAIAAWLDARGATRRAIRLDRGEAPPPALEGDLAIVMGGPMSVNDTAAFPWLATEREWLVERIRADAPLLGVCLGAQQIAAALGARVYRGATREIGWFDVMGQPTQPGDFAFPGRLRAFHWHGDTFDLPRGARRLASSAAFREQAFQHGRHVLALQCHLEVTPAAVATFVDAFRGDLTSGEACVQDASILRNAPAEDYRSMHEVLSRLLGYITDTRGRHAA